MSAPPLPPAAPDATGSRRPGSPRELFVAFTLLALQGFGGVVVVAQRVLCEDKRWLSRAEFVELLSIGQFVPGPNVCNVALMLGDRFFGWRGALAALGGLLTVPFGIVLALVTVYARFAASPAIAGALRGMGAVSAGLIAGTALKLAQSLRTSPLGVPVCVALGAASIAIAQSCPGPNTLYVAAIGFQTAGVAGALAAQAAVLLPSSMIAIAVGRWGSARPDLKFLLAFKAGMAPVTIALLAAASWIIVAEAPGWRHVLLAAAAAVAVWRTRVHILWLMAVGAIAGALAWV